MKVTNTLDLGGNKIINIANAVAAQDPVTKSQLDAAIQGWKWKDPVRVATTAAVTLSGVQSIDGIAVVAGDRVLVKNQADAKTNGIYTASSGAWTRASDFDASNEILGATCFISEGATNGNQSWQCTTDAPIALDTSLLLFIQVGGGQSYSAGTGVVINAGVIAIDTAVVARKSSADIGDGTATTVTVTHGLNTSDVTVSVRDKSSNDGVLCDWKAASATTVQLTFAVAPTTGQYRVTITG